MPKFCQFSEVEKQMIVWVNPELIQFMRPDETHAVTHLVFGEGNTLTVHGNIENTLTVIQNAHRT